MKSYFMWTAAQLYEKAMATPFAPVTDKTWHDLAWQERRFWEWLHEQTVYDDWSEFDWNG